MSDLRTAAQQALEAEPVAGKVVAWGVFANIDGEWQLQHPVFAGDEQGKVNAEFERASYSGPQPLEVRPLGVVTATAQQAEPVQDEPVHDRHGACPTHCCPIHGCKYMHDDCPVVSGAVKPVYPRNNGCESCAEDALAQQAEPVEPVAWEDWWRNHGQYNFRATAGMTFERAKELMKLAFEVGREAAPPQQDEPVEPVDVGLLEYRGNSVGFIYQKLTAYRTGIDAAWDAFRAKGLHPDGKTSLADMIAKYTAPPQRKPLTEEEIYHATGHCGVSKYTAINIARVIEEASWEKNHG